MLGFYTVVTKFSTMVGRVMTPWPSYTFAGCNMNGISAKQINVITMQHDIAAV